MKSVVRSTHTSLQAFQASVALEAQRERKVVLTSIAAGKAIDRFGQSLARHAAIAEGHFAPEFLIDAVVKKAQLTQPWSRVPGGRKGGRRIRIAFGKSGSISTVTCRNDQIGCGLDYVIAAFQFLTDGLHGTQAATFLVELSDLGSALVELSGGRSDQHEHERDEAN